MLVDLTWVPRGIAKTKLPQSVDRDIDMESAEAVTENPNTIESDNEPEVDTAEVLANDLDNLSFYKKGEKDPHLSSDPKADDLFDEEELEDIVLRSTDSIIISVHSGEDVSLLMTHVFDDNPDESDDDDGGAYEPHTYVHHDLVLPTLPLCAAHTSLEVKEETVNLVAVGMFTPGIEIWDVDQVNNLEPVVSLGGYGPSSVVKDALIASSKVQASGKKRKKKKPKLKLQDGSHQDAVMSLSWNSVQREYLASGSADQTVKIWDIESAHCASTFSHHTDKVQAVAFHPSEAELLLTGSFDKTVQILDVRDSGKRRKWSVSADVETCSWGHGPTTDLILTTTEDGYVSAFDTRVSGDESSYLCRWLAHKSAVSASVVSRDVPGMMVTGSVDKQIKVWDISQMSSSTGAHMVYERPSKVGAVFALSLCPVPRLGTNASPFVLAFGGSKGSMAVTDLAVESEAVRNRFLHHCGIEAANVIRKRSGRGIHVDRTPNQGRTPSSVELGKSGGEDKTSSESSGPDDDDL
eukprot:TRINITY_DN1484_c0_g1_i1.p2 TRINITY_DN1484_c0_g1~~TRINITY_DN1484_c0_g1_i1.p2  ORF type:complete len:522 (+),score=87.31 TRINITY_DN1484_c0_g1_i1:302-1867(+)